MATRKESCPQCGSKDNLARWEDGHARCFTPGCGYREAAEGADSGGTRDRSTDAGRVGGGSGLRIMDPSLAAIDVPSRKLTTQSCELWSYLTQKEGGKTVAFKAVYKDDNGKPVAAKVRKPGKEFYIEGEPQRMGLYGQHLWRNGGKMVVVTEGEIDAISVSQIQHHKWPVVSLPNGAQSAKKSLAKAMDWLLRFEHVVLMFDNDEAGSSAALECAAIFPPGRCKIAKLPLKDASDMLMAGRGKEVIDAIWGAKDYKPAGILSIDDVREEALRMPEEGLPWAWQGLTAATYGRRLGEVVVLGAGTGIGKTDMLTQQIAFDILELRRKVAVLSVEQEPSETVKRLAGKVAGRQFHIPDANWKQEELVASIDKLQAGGNLYLFDHWGLSDWQTVAANIRYLAHGEGVQIVYLDHLTAFATGQEEDERIVLEKLVAEAAKLAKELKIVLIMVSHLATPAGVPHEEGGHVSIRHFRGSRAIGYWSHFCIGLERNTMDEDPDERRVTRVSVLKARPCGWRVGTTVRLRYAPDNGLLSEETDEVTF